MWYFGNRFVLGTICKTIICSSVEMQKSHNIPLKHRSTVKQLYSTLFKCIYFHKFCEDFIRFAKYTNTSDEYWIYKHVCNFILAEWRLVANQKKKLAAKCNCFKITSSYHISSIVWYQLLLFPGCGPVREKHEEESEARETWLDAHPERLQRTDRAATHG